MSKEYNPHEHTFVIVKHPKCVNKEEKVGLTPWWEDEAWHYPMEMVLHTGTHVWVHQCYAAEGHSEVKRVGDGRDNGYNQDGNCILSVPAAWCQFYTAEEANGIAQCMSADEALLGYAIG